MAADTTYACLPDPKLRSPGNDYSVVRRDSKEMPPTLWVVVFTSLGVELVYAKKKRRGKGGSTMNDKDIL